jgi:hypothetical protein
MDLVAVWITGMIITGICLLCVLAYLVGSDNIDNLREDLAPLVVCGILTWPLVVPGTILFYLFYKIGQTQKG